MTMTTLRIPKVKTKHGGDFANHDSDMAEWRTRNEFTSGSEKWSDDNGHNSLNQQDVNEGESGKPTSDHWI